MYNGIGLQSARGSGTSGHIVRNLGALKGKPLLNQQKPDDFGAVKVR